MTQAQTHAHNDTHGIVLPQPTPDKLAQSHLPLCLGAYLESHDPYRARMTKKALSLRGITCMWKTETGVAELVGRFGDRTRGDHYQGLSEQEERENDQLTS